MIYAFRLQCRIVKCRINCKFVKYIDPLNIIILLNGKLISKKLKDIVDGNGLHFI
jgi:hypothetical protein